MTVGRPLAILTLVVAWICASTCSAQDEYAFGQRVGVRLGILLVGHELRFAVANPRRQAQEFMTHVLTHEKHYENLCLDVIEPNGTAARAIFVDSSDKSCPVYAVLRPGATFRDAIDVSSWLSRPQSRFTLQNGDVYQFFLWYDASGFRQSEAAHAIFAAGPVASGIVNAKHQLGRGFVPLASD